jgi:tetratricopeptide (TPR) repeat protein
MARVQLFLSTVSAEFLSYRERLRHLLTRPDVEVKVQEDFIVTGDETLEMLDRYIQGCDGVIHLVGDMTGAMAKPPSVAAIARRYPELGSRYPLAEFLQPDGPSLSYTQWEAWLALWHGKKLYIATPSDGAPRDEKYRCEPEQQDLQRSHLARLRDVARYPGTVFSGQEHLVAEVSVSFVLDLLKLAELNSNPYTPHNLPEASGSALPLIGRKAAQARLVELMAQGSAPVVITGMDGVGKTALALHHLRQELKDYGGGVVVLDGQRPLAALVEQLEQFALMHFDQKVPEELPPEVRLAWLYSHWPLPHPVLLLLDELNDPASLQAFGRGLPERFQLLVTSRRQYGTASQRVPLEPLDDQQAAALLEAVSERGTFQEAEQRQARAVAQEVGGLPLALWLLGRRLARDGDLELAELLLRLRAKGALARELQGTTADPLQTRGLQAGFLLAWEGISDAERELALLLGELPASAVPWEFLALSAPPGLDPDDWREARLGLEQQHLIGRPLAGMVDCHPLLHDLFTAEAREGETAEPGQVRGARGERLVEALRQWLSGISDVLEARGLERQQACLPLLEALGQWPAERWAGASAALPHLARGRLLSGLGQYRPAEESLQTALHLTRQIGGAVAAAQEAGCLVALAGLARERNQLETAEAQCRQAMAALEASGDSDELVRAEALNGLGLALNALAEPEAEQALRKALDLRLKRFDGAHPLVQISRNNLAMSLRKLGRAAEAETLYLQVLEALKEVPCEVSVTARYNLSFLADDAGQHERACALREEAVTLAALALGEDHPSRGLMLMSLGVVAEKLGRLEEAEAHFRRAAELTTAAWGADHPQSQNCRLTLEAFLAAPAPLATARPPSDPAECSG